MIGELLINEDTLIKLENEVYTIGRSPDCDLFFNIASLSRYHAWISRNSEYKYLICDGNFWNNRPSKNGIIINGKILNEKEGRILKNGDNLTFSPWLKAIFFQKLIEVEDESTLL